MRRCAFSGSTSTSKGSKRAGSSTQSLKVALKAKFVEASVSDCREVRGDSCIAEGPSGRPGQCCRRRSPRAF